MKFYQQFSLYLIGVLMRANCSQINSSDYREYGFEETPLLSILNYDGAFSSELDESSGEDESGGPCYVKYFEVLDCLVA
ncbi:MAG: hypothetical protein ACSHX0_13350 [Akkermansiaceae bacterium]